MTYVPLWVKSNFSFLEGASHPEELVEQAHALGLPAVSLTDRDGVYGVVRAHMRAKELSLKLILGAEVTLNEMGHRLDRTTQPLHVIALCQTRKGYGNLCQLLSRGRLQSEKGSSEVSVADLCEFAEDLLLLCPEVDLLFRLHDAFKNRLYALVTRHLHADEQAREDVLRKAAKHLSIPVVGNSEVLYHASTRKPLQDVVSCIRNGVIISDAGTHIRANAEHDLKSPHALSAYFEDDPESLARSLEVAERCHFSLDQLRYRYPGETVPNGMSENDWLQSLTMKGATWRYPDGIPEEVQAQIDKELSLIKKLEYGGYFLTMWEVVEFCKRESILCQGRGSAANSVVCYCLGITAVDPIKLDLLFERFLSLERAEPPDIDLDIEHQRREEVIQWVYKRYGRRHAAMVCNVIRYRMRSAMRDVGKVLGLPATAIDRLSKLLGGRFNDLDRETLIYAGLDPEAPIHSTFLRLVDEIQDFPRHLSIHPGGFLLGHEPVDTVVPIEPGTMENRTVIQWDKYAVEDLGLFKVDLLGLGALSQLHACFDLLKAHEDTQLSMATVPHADVLTYEMVSRGDTVGVFQIESRAQMSMLPRLRPETFYDLVIEVALVRPGPIQGDMVHPYLKRRNGEEQPSYPHPALKRVLSKTLGVPIFQEQVMKIAVLVGGYTPGEADQLRRDMAAWKSSGRIERHRERLINRMIQNGITAEFAERIFAQIRGFGEYGFPESHAASFALIAYVTSYMRCHHPAAFACSLLNAQPMGFYSPATIVEDAKRHGTDVLPIDVNRSAWDCTLERASKGEPLCVRMGLRYVKGFGSREQSAFEASPGPYRDLDDLVFCTRLPLASYLKLAETGGLSPLCPERRDALWDLREVITRIHDRLPVPTTACGPQTGFAPLSRHEQVAWDYSMSHHSTRGHPIDCLRDELQRRRIPTAKKLNALRDGSRSRYVGMTICRQRPGTATGVTFYTLEDETGFVNVVVWRDVFERHAIIARTALLMGVTGKVQSESGVIHLVAEELWEPDLNFAPSGTTTRSFH